MVERFQSHSNATVTKKITKLNLDAWHSFLRYKVLFRNEKYKYEALVHDIGTSLEDWIVVIKDARTCAVRWRDNISWLTDYLNTR